MDPSAIDNESYWHRSSSKAFSFDDDDESEFKTLSSFDINVDPGGGGGILNDDTISEASFDNSTPNNALLNISIKSLISDEALKCILEEQSMDERLIPKAVSNEDELKILRRRIQTTLYSPSAEATAQKLCAQKHVHLEVFKSLQDKQQLLDAVLRNGCSGDGLICVLLFLEKTLSKTIFYKILVNRPKALQHYISFIKQTMPREASAILRELGRNNEALMLEFQAVFIETDLTKRKQNFQHILETNARNNTNSLCSLYLQIVRNSIKLLDFVETEGNALDNKIDLDCSPIEALYACCAKNTNWKEPDIGRTISPYRISSDLAISASQFEWCALNERTKAQAYADLQHIFERIPTWHPMKQKQFHINFSLELAILRLKELKAPATVLYLFLSQMGNAHEKLALSKRVECTKAVIDALLSLKDTIQLGQLRDSLAERSEEQFYCDKALQSAQSKRWSSTMDNIKFKL